MRTELSVSMGPMATARASAWLPVPEQIRGDGDAGETDHVAGEDSCEQGEPAADQRALDCAVDDYGRLTGRAVTPKRRRRYARRTSAAS